MTNVQRRQPRGVPTGGEFAANAHDEAEAALAQTRSARVDEDARQAALIASGYLESARRHRLTVENWDYIESDLYHHAHSLSGENGWEPWRAEENGAFNASRSAELRRLTTGTSNRVLAPLLRMGRQAGRNIAAAAAIADTVEFHVGNEQEKARIQRMRVDEKALVDAEVLLGMRRSYRALPEVVSNAAASRSGKVGKALWKLTAHLNRRNQTITELERSALKDTDIGKQSREMLHRLRIADKPSSQIIEEIVEAKKGGRVAASDIRAHLEERSHLELARFQYELETRRE